MPRRHRRRSMGYQPMSLQKRKTWASSPCHSNMSKGTVLVIDAEKDLIELVRYNLDKEGYDVVAANDGTSGLEMATRPKPDLVVLDLMMPGMDGLEGCRRLRGAARTRRIPWILLTGM